MKITEDNHFTSKKRYNEFLKNKGWKDINGIIYNQENKRIGIGGKIDNRWFNIRIYESK